MSSTFKPGSRLILLDRDGVINKDTGYVHKLEDWEWMPGAPEALYELQVAGYRIRVVTNQSGIGRGMYTEDDFHELMSQASHDYFWIARFGQAPTGLRAMRPWEAYHYCPHTPEDRCHCRKPLAELWWREIYPNYLTGLGVEEIDLSKSWFLDDKFENLSFGRSADLQLGWVTTVEDCVREPLDYEVFGSLHHFAETILEKKISWKPHQKGLDYPE